MIASTAMSEPAVVVISDLHLGADALNDFEEDIERTFKRFLTHCGALSTRVEVVINGDLVDFVQAPPYSGNELEGTTADEIPLCFTMKQSFAKLGVIHHQHQIAFDAMKNFIAGGSDRYLTILPGNHDVDFFWPEVRTRFVDLVAGADEGRRARVVFHLDRVYRPATAPELWIEHGHQFDDLNSFFVMDAERWSESSPPIFTDAQGHERLLECVGTRFLIRYLNELDSVYPYVDNVKPFSRFLKWFLKSAGTSWRGPVRAGLAAIRLGAFVKQTLLTEGAGELLALEPAKDTPDDEDDTALPSERAFLIGAYSRAAPDAQRALVDSLAARGIPLDRDVAILLNHPIDSIAFIDALARQPDLLDVLDPPESGETLSLAKGFSISETDALKVGVKAIRGRGHAGPIVMGHTHEIVDGEPAGYFNTGCWIPYLRPDNEAAVSWQALKARDPKLFPHRLMYVLARASTATRLLEFM